MPVPGLGTYADGRPYHALRFIKGDSLKDAIATFHAAPQAVPAILEALEPYRDEVRPLLRGRPAWKLLY